MIRLGQSFKVALAEIFQIFAQTHQTGLLTIHTQENDGSKSLQKYYIWLQLGCIVAVSNRLDGQGLISKIEQRSWLNCEVKPLVKSCPENMPLGIFLRSINVLNSQQLKLLFYAQVLQPVCQLFKLKDGQLEFNAGVTLPQREMTGLSLLATRATLLGLRVLRDWGTLSAKLPKQNSALKQVVSGKSNFKLDLQEHNVWKLANGEYSLVAIAEDLSLTIEKVQQIAFRLTMAGLVEEFPPNDASLLKAGLKRKLLISQQKSNFMSNLSSQLEWRSLTLIPIYNTTATDISVVSAQMHRY